MRSLFTTCLLLLLCHCSTITQSHEIDHRFFLMQLIEKYGHNGSITYEGFERLYKNLGLGGRHEHHSHEEESSGYSTVAMSPDTVPLSRTIRETTLLEDSSEEQLASLVDQHKEVTLAALPNPRDGPPGCLDSTQLLTVYGVPRSGRGMSPVSFLHLCPAIVYQLDQHTCGWGRQRVAEIEEQRIIIPHSSWFFALLTILVISVSGLLCVAIVPLLHRGFISQLISFLVALAVGTLLGDAFLHLIPHALESHGHDNHDHHSHTDSVLKTGLMFLTVVFFFTFEAVLNVNRNNKNKKNSSKHENSTSYVFVNVSAPQNEKEMMAMVEEIQSNPLPSSHGHSHSNTAIMVVLGDGLHNLTDGLAIGAAFSGGLAPGFATAVAVFTHELPHELGDFAVLLQSGVTVRKALIYNVVSSVISFLGTAIGLVVGNFGDATRWIYAITAGSFIYIALSNMVPEINRQKSGCSMIFLRLSGILFGGVIMGSIALYEQDIQSMFS